MARLRYNGLRVTIVDEIDDATTAVSIDGPLNHSGGTLVPSLAGGDYIPLSILDSLGLLSEIVYVTAYTEGAQTATIARGKEGTTAVAHSALATAVCAATVADFPAPGGGGGGGGAGTMIYKGVWVGTEDYATNDVVIHDNGLYIATEDVLAGAISPPEYIHGQLVTWAATGSTVTLPAGIEDGDLAYIVQSAWSPTKGLYPDDAVEVAFASANGHVQVSVLTLVADQTDIVIPVVTGGFAGAVGVQVWRNATVSAEAPGQGVGSTMTLAAAPAEGVVLAVAVDGSSGSGSGVLQATGIQDKKDNKETDTGTVVALGHYDDDYAPVTWSVSGQIGSGTYSMHVEVPIEGAGVFPESSFQKIATIEA